MPAQTQGMRSVPLSAQLKFALCVFHIITYGEPEYKARHTHKHPAGRSND